MEPSKLNCSHGGELCVSPTEEEQCTAMLSSSLQQEFTGVLEVREENVASPAVSCLFISCSEMLLAMFEVSVVAGETALVDVIRACSSRGLMGAGASGDGGAI